MIDNPDLPYHAWTPRQRLASMLADLKGTEDLAWYHQVGVPGSATRQGIIADLEAVLGEQKTEDGKSGIERIAAERHRQIVAKGYTAEHDDAHNLGELSDAAATYARVAGAVVRDASPDEFSLDMMMSEGDWPWDEGEGCNWNPSADPIRNLEKAGALIAAEIDRLQRISK